jgi:hypothetical protein
VAIEEVPFDPSAVALGDLVLGQLSGRCSRGACTKAWANEKVRRLVRDCGRVRQARGGPEFANLFFNADVKKSWGRSRKEKIITFEVAKRIGLLSKTPTGDRIRRYFPDCECRMMNNLGPPNPAATTIAHEAHTHESRPIIDHGEQTTSPWAWRSS